WGARGAPSIPDDKGVSGPQHPWAGHWSSSAPSRSERLPTPSEPRGLLPTPHPPHPTPLAAVRSVLSPSHLVVAPARLAPRFPSEPLPSAI
ncbi:unnamed protein product, partial [Rangifer tarandus platyrhynchus]